MAQKRLLLVLWKESSGMCRLIRRMKGKAVPSQKEQKHVSPKVK